MNITLNGRNNPTNLITFTDIPNILKIVDNAGGTKTTYHITFSGSLAVTSNGQYYITVNGDSINNVTTPQNAKNRNFYISTSNISLASSVARALRNCPNVASSFDVYQDGLGSTVDIKAKSIGVSGSGIQTNIPSSNISYTIEQGTSYSSLIGSQVCVDIYSGSEYVTTLTKNFYNGEVAFNLSPVLTTMARYGKIIPYSLVIYSIKNGELSNLGSINNNYIAIGYMVNQGEKYLELTNTVLAQNVRRGTQRTYINSTVLYTYDPSLSLSLYSSSSKALSLTVNYLTSARQLINRESVTKTLNNGLNDLNIQLSSLDDIFFVDVVIPDIGTIEYNVIKPLRGTSYSQRVWWRNSYGGVSFFDFTGEREETRASSMETYQKALFDYYDEDINELDKVYSIDNTITVTMKSHLISNDGKWHFNDLGNSKDVWTRINGQTYKILITNVEVKETDNEGVYEATIKYKYSQPETIK